MASSILDLADKLKKIFGDNSGWFRQNKFTPVKQAKQYFNPESNRGQNFWSSKTAQGLGNVQRNVQQRYKTIAPQIKSQFQPSTYNRTMQKFGQRQTNTMQNVNKFLSSYEKRVPTFNVSERVKTAMPLLRVPDVIRGTPRMATKFLGFTPEGMEKQKLFRSYHEKTQRGIKPTPEEYKANMNFISNMALQATTAPIESRGMDLVTARQIFKVKKDATPEQIEMAYRNLLKREYPRTVKEMANRSKVNAAKIINDAKNVLMQEVKRVTKTSLLSPTRGGVTIQARKGTPLLKETAQRPVVKAPKIKIKPEQPILPGTEMGPVSFQGNKEIIGKQLIEAEKKQRDVFYKEWQKDVMKGTKKYTPNEIAKIIKRETNAGINVPIAKEYNGSIVKQASNRLVRSVDGFFRSQGEAGKKLADTYVVARREGDFTAGKAAAQIEKALKALDESEIAKFADVAEGKIRADTPALKTATELWDVTRKDVADKAQVAGLQIKLKNQQRLIPFQPKENYFPHYVPEEIIKNARARKDALTKMVQSGWAQNMAEAESKFKQFVRSKIKRRYGNLERAREFDFPLYEKDPRKVLMSYIDSAYHRISDAKYFGSGDEKAYELANQIGVEGGDGELARRALDRIFGKEDVSRFARDVSRKLTGVQTVTKLGLGAITNIGQSISSSLYTNPKVTAQAIGMALGKNKADARYFTQLTGELLDSSKKQFIQSAGGDLPLATNFLQMVKFTASEDFNRIVSSNAGKLHAEQLLEQLNRNPTNQVFRRALERLEINPDSALKAGKLSEEELVRAGKVVTEATQFTTEKFDLPYAWTTPAGRVLTQFKSFAYKQTKFLAQQSKHTAKEGFKGNFRPFATLLFTMGVTAPIAGELINDFKAILRNKKRDEKGIERYVNNIFSTLSLGLVEDAGTLITGKYGASGTIGTLGGPTISDLYKGVTAGQSLFRDRKTLKGAKEVKARIKPGARFTLKQIPIVGPTLANTLVPNKYTKSYIGVNAGDTIKTKEAERVSWLSKIAGKGIKESEAEGLPQNTDDLEILYKDALTTIKGYNRKKTLLRYGDKDTKEEDISKLQGNVDKAIKLKKQIEKERPEQVFEIQLGTYGKNHSSSIKVPDRAKWAVKQLKDKKGGERQELINKLWESGVLTSKKTGVAQYIKDHYGIDVSHYTGKGNYGGKGKKGVKVTIKKTKIPTIKFTKSTAKIPTFKMPKAPTLKPSSIVRAKQPKINLNFGALPTIKAKELPKVTIRKY